MKRVRLAQQDDLGGLMSPRHLQGVSHGAVALAAWLQAATKALYAAPRPAVRAFVRRSLWLAAALLATALLDSPALAGDAGST